MALFRSIQTSSHVPGYKTATDLKWSVSEINGVKHIHIFSDGSDDRPEPKISQVYTFSTEQARIFRDLLLREFGQ